MKFIPGFLFLVLFTVAACEKESPEKVPCISGKIVGQKCDVYALQLADDQLNSSDWYKKNPTTGEVEGPYNNVIGLLNLPDEFKKDDITVFVTLREPTQEETAISCYLDMPGPPSPMYVVVSASLTRCNDTHR